MQQLAISADSTNTAKASEAASLPPREEGLALGYSEMDWDIIRNADSRLLVHLREREELAEEALTLFERAPFERRAVGNVEQACSALGELPNGIDQDIQLLAQCFTALMGVEQVQIRLEAVTSNSCRKIHADHTDLRLITTYAGPGTQVLRHDAEPIEANLWPMEPGWVGLFKGRLFGAGHAPCLHRSPPACDMQASRLVLVIDTPQFPTQEQSL